MSVTVTFYTYTEFCGAFMYGKQINELSSAAQERLDEVLDGIEVNLTTDNTYHPDNLVNLLRYFDDEEAANAVLTTEEIAAKVENGTFGDWMDEHEDEVREAYEEEHEVTVLDREFGGKWVAL